MIYWTNMFKFINFWCLALLFISLSCQHYITRLSSRVKIGSKTLLIEFLTIFYKHFSLLLFSLVLSSLRLFFFYHSLVYRNAESEFYGSEKNFQRLIRVKISCYLSRLIKVSEIKRSRIISIQCLKPALTVSLSGSNLTNFGSTLYFLRNRALFSWKS